MSPQPLLFAYFKGDHSQVFLASSRDGLTFEPLNAGRCVFEASVGSEGLIRDPALVAGPDGWFHMLWTTGWTGRDIGYARSQDLIRWSGPRVIPLMAHQPDTLNCWAPEAVYDPEHGDFMVYWSSTIRGQFPATANPQRHQSNHRIYFARTRDFESFTAPSLLVDPGFNCIDATITCGGDGWVMVLKDETDYPSPCKTLRVLRATSPAGPWGPAGPPISPPGCWVEGPAIVRLGGTWCVYFDKFSEHRYGLICSDDLQTWRDCSDRLRMVDGARHGSILPIDAEHLDALRALG